MKPLVGLVGIGAIQGIAQVPSEGIPLVDVVKMVSSIVVAIGTLIHMFKKDKTQPPKTT